MSRWFTINQVVGLSMLAAGLIFSTAPNSYSASDESNIKDRLIIGDNEIRLQIPREVSLSFIKNDTGKWICAPISVWNSKTKNMTPAFSFEGDNFLKVEGPSGDIDVKADGYEKIQKDNVVGIKFYGGIEISNGKYLNWESTFTVDKNDPLPLLHLQTAYSSRQSFSLKRNPQIAFKTLTAGKESAVMSNIMGYLDSNPGGTIKLEQGYPAVWVHSNISGKNYNCLAIVDTDNKDSNGYLVKKSFTIGRETKTSGNSTIWSIGNSGDQNDAGYIDSKSKYNIGVNLYYSTGEDWLRFYRNTWSGLIDHLCPPEKVPFYATNWEECAKGLVENYKDNDNELYIPGKGYIIGAGGKHTHWNMATTFTHGILYYTWATGDQSSFDFFKQRMMDCDLNQWWTGDGKEDGLNWGWDPKGFAPRGNMWQMLDMGAYPVYNIYKLTGDKYYFNFFKRYIDYIMNNLIANDTIGQNWDVREKKWYYTDYTNPAPEAKLSQSEDDHRDFPGALSVYSYLCLLTYDETGEAFYRDRAYSFIDHINTFLPKPGLLWTIEPYTKTNGFVFAMMSNIKRYELTKNTRYLDYAEQWAYLLLTMYHLKNEQQGGELALAHAGGQGLGEFFCVASLETIEPAYLLANLLKYRINPAFLKFISLTDRMHLIAFPKNHPNYKNVNHIGGVKDIDWDKYLYIPLELIPFESDPAVYMGGAPMVQNMVLHGLHESSDPDITVICTDAAETGLNIKQERNLVVYNPVSINKEFSIYFKGFNSGNYSVEIDGKSAGSFTDTQLKQGIPMKLRALKWSRISITESKK
ncbi:MAG: hypothetical protein ACYC27_04080 [Armatimonadota bacterium]